MKVFAIRHAESLFNARMLAYKEKKLHESKILSLISDPELIDCYLSTKGILQAQNLSQAIEDLKISYVFCSPFIRSIMTINIILENFKEKNKFPTIHIHPLFREKLSSSSSISLFGTKKYQQILDNRLNYNFDEMKKYSDYWLLEDVNSFKSKYILKNSERNFETIKMSILQELKMSAGNNIYGFEFMESDRTRAIKCLDFLNKIRIRKEISGNILIVSHGHLMRFLVKSPRYIENAKIYNIL